MRQTFTLLFCLLVCSLAATAQTISPSNNDEYCPGDYTFTVTVPGSGPNVLAMGGSAVMSMNIPNPTTPNSITFTFIGRLADVNVTQTFRVSYTAASTGSLTSFDFPFAKIKSLFGAYGSACANIYPNVSVLNAPICQENAFTISFANRQFVNTVTGACFGTVTSYEYLLPVNWKLNGQPSTGNWLASNNSVIITSDKVTGGVIKIRAANSCGSSLYKSGELTIGIDRHLPTLTMSGPYTICSGSNYTYTISGIPTGAAATWTSNSYYAISSSGSTATVSPYSYSNGGSTVAATVAYPGCTLNFPVSTNVSLGVPYSTYNIVAYPYEEFCYQLGGIYSFTLTQATGIPAESYQWGYRIQGTGIEVLDPYYINGFTLIPEQMGVYEIFVRPKNDCGVGPLESVRTIPIPCNLATARATPVSSLYPNPAVSSTTVELSDKTAAGEIVKLNYTTGEIRLETMTGELITSIPFNKKQARISINTAGLKAGLYLVRIKRGQHVETKKLIIAK
ncbi:Por secretion system C-terminal sorting domain-containing protein [Filimonas lacunae]|uniref:Por secretion system C-terminal sorting domain-containing protein n=1 Tax=Filimonas lacunae TaxID=477680 RepID=A0A173MQS1_9BACT|nr:T9SS type A sorting domain-containing protein [Filimonas lacunae]BAV10004.1 hypothetical protein FLA_6057 [Filimonas lacunae]SIS82429.1 Por secretion system C-terminal sorting domain-containing protein [Filimonas lacunae]